MLLLKLLCGLLLSSVGVLAHPTTNRASDEPVAIVLDTDIANDVDDVGDLAVLHALAANGEASVRAVITSSTNEYSAATAKAINTYYGRLDIPIGAYQGSIPSGEPSTSVYTSQIAAAFGIGDGRSTFPDSTVVYREALLSSADRSVIIVVTGFFQPLKHLLQSVGNSASSLTGAQLVALKVKRLVVVAGIYPSSEISEWNLAQDPTGAAFVFANWPTEIMSVGIELGTSIATAPPTSHDTSTSPPRLAYRLFLQDGVRPAWGQLGVLYAVRGLSTSFAIAESDGSVSVDSRTGANIWRQTPNMKRGYLKKVASDLELQAKLNALLAHIPSRQ